ncbi:MAG: Ig-like domain-containing protein [Planctomycetes bacterium]|nr:Ig-like domain-containing protein [Planctomycetota bacterium]
MAGFFPLVVSAFFLFPQGCGGPRTRPAGPDTAELVRLKMAVIGKTLDGNTLAENDPAYISPQDARRKLAELLGAQSPPAGEREDPSQRQPLPEPYTPPPVIDLARSAPVRISVADASGRSCPFLLNVQAAGMNILPGPSGHGEYHRGAHSFRVPVGPVRIEVRGGHFRRTFVSEAVVKPGGSLKLRARLESGLLTTITRQGFSPARLLFLGDASERSTDLGSIERVWQTAILAAEPGAGGDTLTGAVAPSWPGYGRHLLLGGDGLADISRTWRSSAGSMPGGPFLSDSSVAWSAVILPGSGSRMFSPKRAYLLWHGLKERFPTAGLFEELLPAELPVLYSAGLSRAVCVPPTPEGLGLFARLSSVYPELLPAPPAPLPGEAFPNVLVWGRPESPADALDILNKGAYSVCHGIFITALLGGQPPGPVEPPAAGTPLWFDINVLTAALSGAAIDEVLVYRNSEVIHRERGHPNQTSMRITVPVADPGPARYWVAAMGHAAESPRLPVPGAAPRAFRDNLLLGLTAPFSLGRPGSLLPQPLQVVVTVKDLAGNPVRDAEIVGGAQSVRTAADGRASVLWAPGNRLQVRCGDTLTPVEPFFAPELFELYQAAHSGSIDWSGPEYANRVRTVLASRAFSVRLPLRLEQAQNRPSKTP